MFLKLLPILLLLMIPNFDSAQRPPIEPGVSQELARWRAARYSDVRYKLNLTLEKMSPMLKGTIEIRVRLSEPPASEGGFPGPLIILDWRKIKGSESLATVSNVSINGTALKNLPANAGGSDTAYEELNEHLIFRDGVVAGENVIKLDFTSPILPSGAGVTRYVDREDGSEYIYSLFVPSDASTAFPVFDQPDLKARFRLNVLAPKEWHVVTNTRTAAAQDYLNIDRSKEAINHIFPPTEPVSTYVFAFAAGPFAGNIPDGSFSSTAVLNILYPDDPVSKADKASLTAPTRIYVRKSQVAKFRPHAAEVFRLNREAVKYLEEYFDYKFPFPKYDLVLIPEFPFGGMEHAGATFLRESSVIFPQVPTANDFISRANLIFHEAAHQWFGDTVTMHWFDDLWLKEGFAEFMAYKTLARVMPQYNAWKAFYERNKPLAYQTDSTPGTTPIYQPIPNLNSAKSAYGNIVYRKAPSFLKQAEFYLGTDKFQTAVRAFLKKHEFKNAEWMDLVREFEASSGRELEDWASDWVTQRGLPIYKAKLTQEGSQHYAVEVEGQNVLGERAVWKQKTLGLVFDSFMTAPQEWTLTYDTANGKMKAAGPNGALSHAALQFRFFFPNYRDYGYGIFLLDDKSRDYVLKNIQNEKDDFLRSMMWGSLWDSVREAELDPREYVELAIKNLPTEKDETITASVLNRVSTAMTYYISDAERVGRPSVSSPHVSKGTTQPNANAAPSLTVGLQTRVESMLINRMRTAPTLGQRITYYRAFLNIASTEGARSVLKDVLFGRLAIEGFNCRGGSCTRPMSEAKNVPVLRPVGQVQDLPLQTILKTKDKFDIVAKLAILNDPEAPKLLADLEKTETSDDAKRYAYAAKAAYPAKETKEKFWNDFVGNKEISESWIEAAFVPFNSVRHADLTLPYLERALKELPNHKRNRKIFFVNGWLAAFIGGQKTQQALDIVNKFLADHPNLDRDLRLKILENIDIIERAVKIRSKYGG